MTKRQSLAHITDEERRDYKRQQATLRKQRQRGKEKEMNTVRLTPELEEFVDELVKLPLAGAAKALALWQRKFKQSFPELPRPMWQRGMTQHDMSALTARCTRFCLIRFFAEDCFEREASRERQTRFKVKEEAEAKRVGVSVAKLRMAKRIAKADTKRRAGALARRPPARAA